jgi:translation initiation factor 2B subunit (eIF-2B alpha/beta/delta family)
MEEAALVIVGADAIRSDGSIVNKVGTRSLALAAQALGKPVYVLAESLKVVAPSYPVEINESASEPMLTPPIFGLKERNPVFDVTPASLITAMVAESGVMDTTAIARSATQAEKAYLALMGA